MKSIRTNPANGAPEGDERCPCCGGDVRDNWFDRSLCPCGTGVGTMHTRCATCGYAFDGCPYQGRMCDAAEDRALLRQIRWRLFKTEWFPYRVCSFLPESEGDIEAAFENGQYREDLIFGPYRWTPSRRGPFASRVARRLILLLNRRAA